MIPERDMSGPAFPTCVASPQDFPDGSRLPLGMTLRDYFAAKALPAVIDAYVEANGRCIGTDHILRNPPIIAYRMADAMLAAREAQP